MRTHESNSLTRWIVLVCATLLSCAHSKAPVDSTQSPGPAGALATPQTSTAGKVAVGLCSGVNGLAKAKAAGFDYVELGVRELASMSETDFEKAVQIHAAAGLPTPVANSFIGGDIKVVGPSVDRERVLAYVKKAMARVQKLGVRIVVFGSGASRKVPDGFSHEEAFSQLVAIAKDMAPIAQEHGVTLAVEPLRKQECNIINTAAEGLRWVKAVDHPAFQLMVDFFHLASENEDPQILLSAREHIKHFHMANPQGRVFPLLASEYDYAAFFANIKTMGFSGGISVEAKPATKFEDDAPKTIALLRSLLP